MSLFCEKVVLGWKPTELDLRKEEEALGLQPQGGYENRIAAIFGAQGKHVDGARRSADAYIEYLHAAQGAILNRYKKEAAAMTVPGRPPIVPKVEFMDPKDEREWIEKISAQIQQSIEIKPSHVIKAWLAAASFAALSTVCLALVYAAGVWKSFGVGRVFLLPVVLWAPATGAVLLGSTSLSSWLLTAGSTLIST